MSSQLSINRLSLTILFFLQVSVAVHLTKEDVESLAGDLHAQEREGHKIRKRQEITHPQLYFAPKNNLNPSDGLDIPLLTNIGFFPSRNVALAVHDESRYDSLSEHSFYLSTAEDSSSEEDRTIEQTNAQTKTTGESYTDTCRRDQIKMTDGTCQYLLTQGNCQPNEEVILDIESKQGICVERLCPPDRIFCHNTQLCHDPLETFFCPAGRELFYTAYGTCVCSCPDGTMESDDDLDDDVCDSLLNRTITCAQGGMPQNSVFWLNDFISPPQCLPDPCGGTNSATVLRDDLPFLPTNSAQCKKWGDSCTYDQYVALDLQSQKGECSDLENAGYEVFNDTSLQDVLSNYGPLINRNGGENSGQTFNTGIIGSPQGGQSFNANPNFGQVNNQDNMQGSQGRQSFNANPNFGQVNNQDNRQGSRSIGQSGQNFVSESQLIGQHGQRQSGNELDTKFSVNNHMPNQNNRGFHQDTNSFQNNQFSTGGQIQNQIKDHHNNQGNAIRNQSNRLSHSNSNQFSDVFRNEQGMSFSESSRDSLGLNQKSTPQDNFNNQGFQGVVNGQRQTNRFNHQEFRDNQRFNNDFNNQRVNGNSNNKKFSGNPGNQRFNNQRHNFQNNHENNHFRGQGLQQHDFGSQHHGTTQFNNQQQFQGGPFGQQGQFSAEIFNPNAPVSFEQFEGNPQEGSLINSLEFMQDTFGMRLARSLKTKRLPIRAILATHVTILPSGEKVVHTPRFRRSVAHEEQDKEKERMGDSYFKSVGEETLSRKKRDTLRHASPSNVFETRLLGCRPGASRDINSKCRKTILPARVPKRRGIRAAPPVPPTPSCPNGYAWDIRRQCVVRNSARRSVFARNLG